MQIWVVATQVLLGERFQELATKKVLDILVYEKAQKSGKKVGGLETVEEQMALYDEVCQQEQIRMLTKTLDLYDRLKHKTLCCDWLRLVSRAMKRRYLR